MGTVFFYSKGTTEFIKLFISVGMRELSVCKFIDYDLTQHQNVSGQDMTYFDDTKRELYFLTFIKPLTWVLTVWRPGIFMCRIR